MDDSAQKFLRWVSIIALMCLGFGGVRLWSAYTEHQELARVDAWDAPPAWYPARCKVVTAGVACVEEDTGSTCGGLGANGSSHHVVDGSNVYTYKDIAVCPGTYWCAAEGQDCTCDGEVDFAPQLFNGFEYTRTDPEFRRPASGTVRCGTDQRGEVFKRDPAPYHIKHCWCTPRIIIEKLRAAGGVAAARTRRDTCAREGQADYEAARGVPPQSEAETALYQRRLAGLSSQSHPDRRGSSEPSARGEVDDDDGDFAIGGDDSGAGRGVVDDGANASGAGAVGRPRVPPLQRPRQLTSSPRRRRTYSYTPWALVEVQRDKDSDGFGGQTPGAAGALTCAYDFGVPAASYKAFESDGTATWFGGDPGATGAAQAMTEQWAAGETTACFTRWPGKSGADACAVAMEPLFKLGEKRHSNLFWTILWGAIPLSVGVCISGGMIWLLWCRAPVLAGYEPA